MEVFDSSCYDVLNDERIDCIIGEVLDYYVNFLPCIFVHYDEVAMYSRAPYNLCLKSIPPR